MESVGEQMWPGTESNRRYEENPQARKRRITPTKANAPAAIF
jgi:hypothetical protein